MIVTYQILMFVVILLENGIARYLGLLPCQCSYFLYARMNMSNRSLILVIILLLFIFLLPAFTGLVGLMVDTELSDNDDFDTLVNSFIASVARITVPPMMSGLMLGMSIFTLFVVYQGGRSNRRLFNDRTIDAINLFRGIFSETALCRAVFVFRFPDSPPEQARQELTNVIPFPTLILSVNGGIKHAVSHC